MPESTSVKDDESLKLAIAISLLRSKAQQEKRKEPNTLDPSQSDALRWKQKAKERKQELLRLREDLKEAQDASQCELFPESASCKCLFLRKVGESSGQKIENSSVSRFNDVLRRRFLRQVRFKERSRRVSTSSQRRPTFGSTVEDETEQLRSSVDFLLELCETVSPYFLLIHLEILNVFSAASLKNLLSMRRNLELVEGIISNLVTRLVRQMCSPLQPDGSERAGPDAQIYIQHLIRKLGIEPYIGQRAIFSVSQRISVLAERLLFSDPFDDGFPDMHECMFIMIQLIEFLVSDYFLEWSKAEDLDNVLLEDWVTSILHARKALELLESRNGLYVLYMDRLTGELAKRVSQASSLQNFKPDIFNALFG
ncbi:LOW QUALITY PROTEIN: protein MULTIPOLAR SPINDLE 1 [Neltuma alba]|uniref:LOW QUALITY PROTEIN: protein MULTIPOLAR SPINDLE 1 n=1 Tax=Neltuma alba TaxID=207710 RepID=UPI0010A50FE4|nr:LOW QUALITY PROTEIN: protein MULTIPOLAR SPINDLE 1 [Prosopis alba]